MARILPLLLLLAGCAAAPQAPVGGLPPAAGTPPGPARTVADFAMVADRVEPAAEQVCHEQHPGAVGPGCDFVILLDTDPRMPPNAFQTVGRDGRPEIIFGAALLGQLTNDDEIAFVLSHEASHQIAGHIAKERAQSILGALVFGRIAAGMQGPEGQGPSEADIRQAMDIGAYVGSRAYSKTYELEADRLGAYVAARAGFDPQAGAQVFTSPALSGGGALLSTHPGSAERIAAITAIAAEIRRQQAAGVIPSPAYAG